MIPLHSSHRCCQRVNLGMKSHMLPQTCAQACFRLRTLLRPLKRAWGLSWESWGMPCNLHDALETSRWIEIARSKHACTLMVSCGHGDCHASTTTGNSMHAC